MYPISKIILQAISGSKENKLRIVNKLGYKNISKGLRRLDRLIYLGWCPESMRDRISYVLGLNPEVIEQAFKDTVTQKEEEEEESRVRREEYYRSSFQPHIWILHEFEKPPLGSICIVGFIGVERWKVLKLPKDIGCKPWSQQFRLVRENIREHQQSEDVGRGIFGKVLGYLYRNTYDKGFLFANDGALLQIFSPRLFNPDLNISVGNKTFRGDFLKSHSFSRI